MKIRKLLSFFVALVVITACSVTALTYNKESYSISQIEARKTAKEFLENNLNLKVNENDIKIYSGLTSNRIDKSVNKSNGKLSWKLFTSIKQNDESMDVYVYIDPENGKVLTVNIEGNEDESKETLISPEDALIIAESFIKKTNPQQCSEVLLSEDVLGTKEAYTFLFTRYISGVKYYKNFIEVSVDKNTGIVTYYGWRWDNSIDSLFGQEHAKDAARRFLSEYYDFHDESAITMSFDYEEPITNHYYDDELGWEISIDIVDGDKNYNSFISVSIFTGEVVYIRIDDATPWGERQTTFRVSKDDARTIAEEFLKKVAPEKFKETTFMGEYNTPGEGGPSFHFARIVNGAIYDSNFLELSIDVSNGKVRFFGCAWDENLVFPNTDGIISEEEAIKIMRDELQLIYSKEHDSDSGSIDFKPVYCLSRNFTGSIDSRSDYIFTQEEKAKRRSKDISLDIKSINKSNNNSIEIMDKEVAIQNIKKCLKTLLDKDFNIIGLEYNDYNEKTWFAHFESTEKENKLKGEIEINAINGKLTRVQVDNHIDADLQVYKNEDCLIDSNADGFKGDLTWEDGYERVIEMVSKIYPDKIENIRTKIEYPEFSMRNEFVWHYTYSFPRIENGLPIEYSRDGIRITIDSEGNLLKFTYKWDNNLSFLKPDTVISHQEATKSFFGKYKPLLMYEKSENGWSEDGFDVKLVYKLPYEALENEIDAITGDFKE